MTEVQLNKLQIRNNKIIEVVLKQIEEKCPNSVDLIGIGGSFCNGDIHEKSDLDLVIVRNKDGARCLDKCFIIGDVGIDIYTRDWASLEKMTEYKNQYVTKLFDLKLIYVRNEESKNRYHKLQEILINNMHNTALVNKNISNNFIEADNYYQIIQRANKLDENLINLAHFIMRIETALFLVNHTYARYGIKRFPEEISKFNELPENFMEDYKKIVEVKSVEEMKLVARKIYENTKMVIENKGIKINFNSKSGKAINDRNKEKAKIKKKDIIGTYEELYSNWKNKMYDAISLNSKYYSFMTMACGQDFYDEFSNEFDIKRIELLKNYNSDYLEKNAFYYDKCMEQWKCLYDDLGVKVNYYAKLDELDDLYNGFVDKQNISC